MESNVYYTYAYLDPRKEGPFSYGEYTFTHEPFYIGKGKGRRSHEHLSAWSLKGSDSFKNNKIKKIISEGLKPIIVKILENLSDEDACTHERNIISVIGRSNTNCGPLTNNTDGGETSAGAIYSDKSRALMSAQRKGKKQTPAQYVANCSRKVSEDYKKKLSETQKGIRRLTDEQYAAIAEKNRGQKRSDEIKKKLSEQRKGKKQTPAQYEATLERARKRKALNDFPSFEVFKLFAKSIPKEFHSARGLKSYTKANDVKNIPRNPYCYYRSVWISWSDIFTEDA